jgi:hypothetical protein
LFTRYVRVYITLRWPPRRKNASIRTISAGISATPPVSSTSITIHGLHRQAGNTTGLCRIAPDGTISLLANDFQDARGVAVDAPRHLLYAIDRAGSTGGTSYVRIFPLN